MLDAAPYVYAKACGIIGKSFVGKRSSSLSNLHSLSELDRLVFPDHHRELPAREMLADIEKRIIDRTVRQIMLIAGAYENPPEIIVRMLRSYEYGDLKICIQRIASGKKEPPFFCDIGRFKTVNFDAYPDMNAMLKNTEFEFLLPQDLKNLKTGTDTAAVETKIDALFYSSLIEDLYRLSAEDRETIQRMLADEISLRNCTWAMRLRTYYQKMASEALKHLMDIKLRGRNDTSLAAEAVQSLDFPLDTRSSWNGWKWEKLLNSEQTSSHWAADPRHFQNAASGYLYKLAMRSFHRTPLSVSSVFCFIKIKQFEEDLLTSVAEGLALGLDSAVVFKLLEVS
jgi:vacuolar-type H+-ATPase subunit C/Vma6